MAYISPFEFKTERRQQNRLKCTISSFSAIFPKIHYLTDYDLRNSNGPFENNKFSNITLQSQTNTVHLKRFKSLKKLPL